MAIVRGDDSESVVESDDVVSVEDDVVTEVERDELLKPDGFDDEVKPSDIRTVILFTNPPIRTSPMGNFFFNLITLSN